MTALSPEDLAKAQEIVKRVMHEDPYWKPITTKAIALYIAEARREGAAEVREALRAICDDLEDGDWVSATQIAKCAGRSALKEAADKSSLDNALPKMPR